MQPLTKSDGFFLAYLVSANAFIASAVGDTSCYVLAGVYVFAAWLVICKERKKLHSTNGCMRILQIVMVAYQLTVALLEVCVSLGMTHGLLPAKKR